MFVREESVHIEVPPEAVYDYVSDIARHPEWAAQKMVMRQTGDGKFESVVTMGFMKARADIHIEAAKRPERFVYVADDNVSGPHRWSFDVRPDAGGSNVTFRMQRLHEAVWARIVQPLVLWPLIGHPGVITGLARIKRRLEGAETQSTAAPSAS